MLLFAEQKAPGEERMVQKISPAVLAVVLALLAVVTPGSLSAQQMGHIVYLDGQVFLHEYPSGPSEPLDPDSVEPARVQVEIGDTLPSSGVLILNDNSLLEIETPTNRILLTRPGRYELGVILGMRSLGATRELGEMVRTRVRSLSLDPPSQRVGVAAGVRGTEGQMSGGASTWASGDLVSELVSEALAYREAGQYQTALDTLKDAAALGADGPEFMFYLGYLHYLNANLPDAYRFLSRFSPEVETPYYRTHVLVLAQLHYDGFSFSAAADLLVPFVERQLDRDGGADLEPVVLLVLSLDAAGRHSEANSYLTRMKESPEWLESEGIEQLWRLGEE